MKYRKAFALLLILTLLPLSFFPARAEKNTGLVRVLLTRLALTDRVEIALDGSYTLRDISFQRGSHLTAALRNGAIFVYYEGMAMNAGKEVTLQRHAIADQKENGFRINGAYELHPGDLTLTISNGQLRAILTSPVEEYLLGVVPYEMSDSFPLEALKAQAIAARTYVMRKAQSNKNQAYDVVDNTNDQAYYGVKKENDRAAQAVRETAGVCGYYKGSLAECFYSASNGGQTELPAHVWGRGDYGYFSMTDDPYDLENKESAVKSFSFLKKMRSNEDLGKLKEPVLGALSETLEAMGYDGDTQHIQVTGVESAQVDLPLYADSPSKIMTLLRLSLQVKGRKLMEDDDEADISIFSSPAVTSAPSGSKRETWSDMQPLPQAVLVTLDIFPVVESALDLSINGGSNEIMTIRETDTAFCLESRRYGHGVGMSQRGAQQMAGVYQWTYQQILRFYYPGMELKTITYSFTLPAALSQQFLATPGPAATPTPRPTLMPIASTPAPGQSLVKVANIGVNSYLNLRAEPNTQCAVVRQLYYGQELIVLKELGDWLQVRTDEVTGYVMTQFVVKEEAKQ